MNGNFRQLGRIINIVNNIIRTTIICFILMISFNYKEIYANPNNDYNDIESRIEKIEKELEKFDTVAKSYNELNEKSLNHADSILNRIMYIVTASGGALSIFATVGIFKNVKDQKRFKELKDTINYEKLKLEEGIKNSETEFNSKVEAIGIEYEDKFEEYKLKIDAEVQKQIQESINNNKISVYRNEIEQLIKDKNYNSEFEKYKQIEKLHNDKISLYNIKSWLYLQAYIDNRIDSYFSEAVDAYEKLINLYKENEGRDNSYYENLSTYYNNLGNAYHANRNYENSIKSYKEAIKINNNNNRYYFNAMYYINLGNAYYEDKDYENAIESYKEAININKYNKQDYNNINCYINLGNAYYANMNYESAIESYEEVININNKYEQSINNKVIYLYLGNAYYANKNYENAINLYKQLITVDNEELVINKIKLGNAYSNNGDYEELIDLYEEVLIKYPNKLQYKEKAYIYSELGEAYCKLEKFEKSILSGEEAVKIEKKGMYFLRLANTYREYDSIYKAKENYKIAIEKQSEQIKKKEAPIPFFISNSENTYSYAAEACMYLGECLYNENLYDEAKKYIVEALEYNIKAISSKEPYKNIEDNHKKIQDLLKK